MTDDNRPSRGDEDEPTRGILGAIRRVVDALAEAERDGKTRFGGAGRIPGNHFTTQYGFSGRIGGPRGRTDSTREAGDRHLVDVRETDDELLVVADMPAVERKDISVGVDEDRNEFVVGVGNEAVERMELPWPVEDVDAQFQHGVLELRFTRKEGER